MYGNYRISYNELNKDKIVYVYSPMSISTEYAMIIIQESIVPPLSFINETEYGYSEVEKLSEESCSCLLYLSLEQQSYYHNSIGSFEDLDHETILPMSYMRYEEEMYV